MMSETGRKQIFAGVEGGATLTSVVLVDQDGKILSWTTGQSTNYLLVGIDKCHATINQLIDDALAKAEISSGDDFKLESLVMALSGCEDKVENEKFSRLLQSKFPKLSKSAFAVSDTVGPIYTACPNGGVVLISGTGSNSLLINPDSSEGRCGGWGHILGDEGAAYWISRRAIKYCIDHLDNLKPSPYPIDNILRSIYAYFKVDNLFGLLPYAYTNFRKPHFAGLCAEIAKLADEEDEMAQILFYEAGSYLAWHVLALLPKIDPALLEAPGGLHIVCIGSVFKSWKHIEKGFRERMAGKVKEISLVRLKVSSALGCAYLAGKKVGTELPIQFSENYEIFCRIRSDE